eukprot:11261430-Ditylum_brightwellii.AAC.2
MSSDKLISSGMDWWRQKVELAPEAKKKSKSHEHLTLNSKQLYREASTLGHHVLDVGSTVAAQIEQHVYYTQRSFPRGITSDGVLTAVASFKPSDSKI